MRALLGLVLGASCLAVVSVNAPSDFGQFLIAGATNRQFETAQTLGRERSEGFSLAVDGYDYRFATARNLYGRRHFHSSRRLTGSARLCRFPRRRRSFLPAPRRRCGASFRPRRGCTCFRIRRAGCYTLARRRICELGRGAIFSLPRPADQRTTLLVREAYDVDFIEAESEVDALLMEARLIKDIQPKYNRELRDDKSFPYLQITTHEDFPRIEVTREPRTSGVKLYGPFFSAGSLRGAMQILQRVFKFRTCPLDIVADDERWRWFRPCLLGVDQPVHGAVQSCAFRKRNIAKTSNG